MAGGCAHHPDRPYMMSKSVESRGLGAEAYASGELERALEKFREALRIDRSIDNRSGEMLDLINLGRVYISLGKYREATDFLNEAVTLGVVTGDERNLSEAHATFAKAEYLSGQTGTALDHMEESLQIDGRMGYKSASRLNLKGFIYIDSGRYDEAGEIIKEALRINAAEGDAVEAANSYRALGEISGARGMSGEALAFFEKAYEIDLAAGDPRKIAHGLGRMAELNLKDGRREKALFLFERYYVVSFNSGQRESTLDALGRLIDLYMDMGETGKAVFYQKVKDSI
ncbi:MAG: tetratricopeptide repeat protein [Deltaproteobacteria bacterium]|nr:tetratricopeptide repeat protein [Deltaproteobacteria bacterium]